MTTVRTQTTRPSALSAYRVGPVITTLAAVVGASVMFGLGVLLGRVGAAVLGIHGAGRTGVMLGAGVVLGLCSIVSSARRHLPRR
ncbi:MAG: hypothetical protein QOJ83_2789 [Frankiales bacterium]|jgi:hypothetical protein|nr:hypothetical protein [Frankiales bacterium]